MIGNNQGLHIPLSKPKGIEVNTKIDKSSRKPHAETDLAALIVAHGHSATPVENKNNIFFMVAGL